MSGLVIHECKTLAEKKLIKTKFGDFRQNHIEDYYRVYIQ
jgi:hypothetical protein